MVPPHQNSLSRVINEGEQDVNVVLDCERVGGAFGEVVVLWEVIGDHSVGEVTPTTGQVQP